MQENKRKTRTNSVCNLKRSASTSEHVSGVAAPITIDHAPPFFDKFNMNEVYDIAGKVAHELRVERFLPFLPIVARHATANYCRGNVERLLHLIQRLNLDEESFARAMALYVLYVMLRPYEISAEHYAKIVNKITGGDFKPILETLASKFKLTEKYAARIIIRRFKPVKIPCKRVRKKGRVQEGVGP